MALERRNPVPVGRYWLDVPASKVEDFNGFLKSNSERIHVENTEGTDVVFYIFSVSEPVQWFAANFGFPEIAGANVQSKADAVQTPDLPPSAADTAEGLLNKAGKLVEFVGIGLGLLLALKLLEATRKK